MSSSSRSGAGGLGARIARQLRQGVAQVASTVESALRGEPSRTGDAATLTRVPEVLRDLRSAHLPEAAYLLADLVPRSLQTGQAAAAQLPGLLKYEDPQLLSLYHATVVAALSQERDAGPLLARSVPEHLARVGAEDRRRFMSRVLRGAYVDWNLALVLAENLPDLLGGLTDDALDTFLRRGFALWRENPDKAMSFLRLESRLGQMEVESLRQSLPLSGVRRTLQLYAQAHGGAHIRIRSIDELPAELRPSSRTRAFTDGRNIYLPAEAGAFGSHEENFRLFKAMTAIEAGRIEFGTFQYRPGEADGDGQEPPPTTDARGLYAHLESLHHREVAMDLFGVLETFRIEQRVRFEYPGLVQDLERLTEEAMGARPLPAELEPLPAVLELFAQRLWGGEVRPDLSPKDLEPLVSGLEKLAGRLAAAGATVEDSLACTQDGLKILEGLLPGEPARAPERPGGSPSQQPGGREEQSSAGQSGMDQSQASGSRTTEAGARQNRESQPHRYQSFEPLPHQGRVWLDLASELEAREEEQASEQALAASLEEALKPGDGRAPSPPAASRQESPGAARPGERGEEDEPAAGASDREARGGESTGGRGEGKSGPASNPVGMTTYPEWDWQIDDYKDNWCQVLEERLPEGAAQFAEETLASYGPIVNRLKRQFQRIRREEFEKLRRQPDGDEIDFDAALESLVERHGGRPPSERVYVQRQKRVRDVAVAFLVDMSSSTQQVVQASGKTILDIEKESLLLMAEALEALGDPYAVYGFSGYGRRKVSYYVAKEFNERYGTAVRQRIGGMSGRLENRDGAAIRHTVKKLLAQPARVRLLILLSDGRPLDCGCRQYFERYAQEDTRMALREARRQNVHPFCITVDRQAQRYLSRMYGQVQYTIIDQVSALPYRLPNIYRRLTT